RRDDRPGAPDVEGALPADADRAVRPLAPRGRLPVRPVAAHARARRRGDPLAGAAIDEHLRPQGGLGGLDGPPVPGGRRVRRAGCARTGAFRERRRDVRRAERLAAASGLGRTVYGMAKPLEEWSPAELRAEVLRLTEELARRAAAPPAAGRKGPDV